MGRFRVAIAGLGFIMTGLLVSSFMAHVLPEIRMFGRQIFRTNCMLLLGDIKIDPTVTPQQPLLCSTIGQVLPVLLMATGLLLCLFGMTRFTCFLSIMNLIAFTSFYCNPMIDSSFRSYSHFLQVAICIGAFLIAFLAGGVQGAAKTHRD